MRKGLSNILSRETLTNIILVLYFLSIFLDLHLFYNNVSTLIRVIFISVLFLITFIKYGDRKSRKLILLYFFIYIIYGVLHLLNIKHYHFSEILYLVKMFMGIFIIYTVYKLGIDTKSFTKTMNYSLLVICGSIVLCNIFKIGYTSYDFTNIKYNIFSWFKGNNDYLLSSNKGFFHATNQIIAIIILYLPLLINNLKERVNFKNIGLLFLCLLSLLMIGNRVSSYVPSIVLIISVIGYLFLVLIKKEKFNLHFLTTLFLLMTIFLCLLKVSPINERNKYYQDLIIDKEVVSSNTNIDEINIVSDVQTIDSLFNAKLINLNFPKYYYPYENDQEFWDEMLKKNKSILVNARYLEKEITKRIIDLNNNQTNDRLLGIGYTRIIRVHNIEQDYIMQYYTMGIIGLIVIIGVYIVLYLYLCVKTMLNFDVKFTYKNMMLLLSIGLVLTIAYFSGNLLNSISVIIPFNFVIGIAFVEINESNNKYKDMILGFKTYTQGKETLLKQLEKEDKQNIIININPLIVSNYYNKEEYVKEFNIQKYNIPDGFGIVLASKIKNGSIAKQIPGVELMEDICKLSSKKEFGVYLYGAKKEVIQQAKENLEKKYHVSIVGMIDGYVKNDIALKDILKSKPDVLFVALGSPKQEEFIINNKEKLKDIKIIMPVGGSFDVISGYVKRAPKFFIKLHLEWLYRMLKEPKRIKQNMGIIRFLWLVIFKNNWYNENSEGANNDKNN